MRHRILSTLLLLLAAVVSFLLPTAYVIISSLQKDSTLTLQPTAFSLDRYLDLFFGNYQYYAALLRSVWIALSTAVGATALAFVAGYVFAKVRFRFCSVLFACCLLLMLCPYQVTIVPNYLMIRLLGLYNTDWALILPGLFTPMLVFLMRQFIRQVDDSLCAAFRLESDSTLQLLVHVMLPCSSVGTTLVFVLAFSEAWNMVEQPLILLEKAFRYPLSVLLDRVLPDGTVMAGSAVFMLPVFFLITLFHDQLLEGMAQMK